MVGQFGSVFRIQLRWQLCSVMRGGCVYSWFRRMQVEALRVELSDELAMNQGPDQISVTSDCAE